MELVVEDAGLWRIAYLEGGGAEGLPHVHDGQANALVFPGTQPLEEEVQALLGTIQAPEPNGTPPYQVADHDPVSVSFADGDLVDADHCRAWGADTAQLLAHVLLVQFFDGLPIEAQLPSHVLDGRRAATSAYEKGEPLGVERVVGQPGELLLLHGTAPPAVHAPDLHLQVDPRIATREVSYPANLVIVESPVAAPTDTTNRFFPRRSRRTTRALGSPKMPRTVARGRKPGNRYVSSRRRCFRIAQSCQVLPRSKTQKLPRKIDPIPSRGVFFTHSLWRRAWNCSH